MIQQRKASIVRVSRLRRHQPFDKKKHLPIKKRRANPVIHVAVGSRPEHPFTNNNSHSISIHEKQTSTILQPCQKTIKSSHLTKNSLSQNSNCTKISYLSRSNKVTDHEGVSNGYTEQNKNEFFDQMGMTIDYHQQLKRNKKKKCSRRCFIISLVVALLCLLIIAGILLALLIKPKSMKTTPSTIPVLRWNTTGITVAGIVGSPGNANNQLNIPLDVTLDYANNLYIADYGNHRIQKYLFGSSTGMTIAGNGTPGSSPYQLNNLTRVTIDANSNLYVSDTFNQRIQFWPNGAISGTTIAGVTGSSGNAYNQLSVPYGVALDPTSGTLYIAGYGNHRIMSYASGANNGTLVLGGNGPGINNTQLNKPTGLYFDAVSNSLIIANFAANNIVRYTLGATGWTLVAGDINGTAGTNSTLFISPLHMTFDPMGNMYVADRDNQRIQFFYAGQLSGSTIAGITSKAANNATTLNGPWSVALDSQLNLYVADAYNQRIQKFLRY